MPAGRLSTKFAVSAIGAAFGLPSVSVRVALPPATIDAGAMPLPSVGPTTVTVSGADAAGAVPVVVESAPVVLVTVPGVLEVMPTTIVQPPEGIAVEDAMVIVLDVTDTPPHVPVFAVVVVTPAASRRSTRP